MTSLRHIGNDTLPSFTNVIIDQGRLRILDKIHAGSSGSIYRAEMTTGHTRREFAVKCMPKSIDDDELGSTQSQEGVIHQLLSKHPNIVTMFRLVYDDDFAYLVLDYAKDGDLFDYLLHSPYNDDKIKRTFIDMISAVEACHIVGVYHRDIKPENFLLNDGRCLLADFSSATFSAYSNDYNCSRLEYMSPEAIWTDYHTELDYQVEFSHRANDVWALGITLFNMITGSNAWNYALNSDVNYALFVHHPEAFRERFGLSRAAFYLLCGFLAIDPEERKPLGELKEEVSHIKTFYGSLEEIVSRTPKRRRHSDSSLMSIDTIGPQTPEFDAFEPSIEVSDLDIAREDWEDTLEQYSLNQDDKIPGWAKETRERLQYEY